jgi:LysR family nod box-dependent transcriptional activator
MSEFDFNLLRPLDALLETRSVTLAAERLGVSQPTMSGMLARLRVQFHDPLLVRAGPAMELTPRAQDMVQEVRQALLRIQALAAPPASFRPQEWRQHLRIMTSEFGLFLALPRLFASIVDLAPHLTFEAVAIDRPVRSVYRGDVDLCLTGDILQDVAGDMADTVRTQVVATDRFVGIVDDAHPLEGRATIEALLSYPHVATQFPGSRWTVEDIGLAGLSGRHPPRARVASFLALGPIIAGTRAIGIVPSLLAELTCAGKCLRTIELPEDFSTVSIRLLWHGRYDQDPAHAWFRGLIAEVCAKLAPPRS